MVWRGGRWNGGRWPHRQGQGKQERAASEGRPDVKLQGLGVDEGWVGDAPCLALEGGASRSRVKSWASSVRTTRRKALYSVARSAGTCLSRKLICRKAVTVSP